MTEDREYVGELPVFYNPKTRSLEVDDSVVEDAIAGDDDYGDDDYGDDDYGDDDDVGEGDDGEDFDADEGDVGEDDDDVGRGGRGKRRRKARRSRRKARRNARRGGSDNMSNKGAWISDIRSGEQTTAAGVTAVSITIQNASEFRVDDVCFEGSDTGAKITKIKFGDDTVLDLDTPVPVSLFGPTSTLRKKLKGKTCPRGSVMIITGSVAAATDTFAVQLIGHRWKQNNC